MHLPERSIPDPREASDSQEHGGRPLMRLAEVEQLTTLHHRTIVRLVSQQQFPAPVQLSARRRAWRRSEVTEFLAGRRTWPSG